MNNEEELEKTLEKAETSDWARCPQCGDMVEKMASSINENTCSID
jgi:hypothetical protein